MLRYHTVSFVSALVLSLLLHGTICMTSAYSHNSRIHELGESSRSCVARLLALLMVLLLLLRVPFPVVSHCLMLMRVAHLWMSQHVARRIHVVLVASFLW